MKLFPTKFSTTSVICAGAILFLASAAARADEPVKPATTDKAALEREFEASMQGVYLRGYFTLLGREQQGLKEEKYTISSIKKVGDDKWLFNVRIQYGKNDVTLPLTLDVKWAGDTPVVTLTDMLVPGLGTFTARVAFYRGQYAGTWDGGKEPDGSPHGGHLFGRIEKIEK